MKCRRCGSEIYTYQLGLRTPPFFVWLTQGEANLAAQVCGNTTAGHQPNLEDVKGVEAWLAS